MREHWSSVEVEAVVSDYFEMLDLELRGVAFDKTQTRMALMTRVSRSEGSIERKRQNISAILMEEGRPYIWGYKPLRNYQRLLREVVVARLDAHPELEPLFRSAVDAPIAPQEVADAALTEEGPPTPREAADVVSESRRKPIRRVARRIDYFAREATNQSIGLAGEKLVVDFEMSRLRLAGRDALADRIEHIAAEQGDGLGFDIRSFELDGRERLIEVKTTVFSKVTPFFVTRCEVAVSQEHGPRYHLYRVFKLRDKPGLFRVPGPLTEGFRLQPEIFRARVA